MGDQGTVPFLWLEWKHEMGKSCVQDRWWGATRNEPKANNGIEPNSLYAPPGRDEMPHFAGKV